MRVLFLTADRLAPRSGLVQMAWANRRALRSRLGVEACTRGPVPLDEIPRAVREARADAAVLAVSWDHRPEDVIGALRGARDASPATKLVFFDWSDNTSTWHFVVLPHVDVFAKAQVLRDPAWYSAGLKGGYAFTDFLARTKEIDLTGWAGSAPARDHAGKIVVAWNIGALRTYRRMLRVGRVLGRPWALRTIDVHARVGVGDGQTPWYGEYRKDAVARLGALVPEFRVARGGMVSRGRYWSELLRSRIVFSPFGWGEVCYRDFEAVCCGCLLVKPSVAHLRTSPDIFGEFETYVPVRWDLADLAAQCRAYLAHPREARRIAGEARRRLGRYFAGGGIVSDVARILERLGSPGESEWGTGGSIPWREPEAAVAGGVDGQGT